MTIMNKIRALLYKVHIDKQLHFTWSFILGTYFFLILYFVPIFRSTLRPYEIAIITLFIVGLGFNGFKELLDVEEKDGQLHKKKIDWYDIGTGCLGVLIAVITLMLILN